MRWPEIGVVMNLMHDRQQPLLRVFPKLDGDALTVDAALPDTQRGRDVAADMRQENPLYTGLSVEFRAEQEGRRGGLREIRRAYMPSAGLVDRGAYAGSTVEVRSESGLILPRAESLWL
jgi:phage head maturation protease